MQLSCAFSRLALVGIAFWVCDWSARLASAEPRRVPAKDARDDDRPIRFELDILPLLTQFGCNAGNCHGASGGKGGLALSLFGSRPIRDYVALVDGPGSILIDGKDPGRSLLLRKPTQAVDHSGGKNMEIGSPEYTLLRRWIEMGTPAPQTDDPRIVRLDVLPNRIHAKRGDIVRLVVKAVDNDMRARDVSRAALVRIRATTDDELAKVLPDGRVEILGSGFGLLTVTYSRNSVTIPIRVPYDEQVIPIPTAGRPLVDRGVVKGWNRMRLVSAKPAEDHVFMRRVSLHLIGRPPTPKESIAFGDSKETEKRRRLIDTLLEKPEHAVYWASLWRDWLRVDSEPFSKTENTAFDSWLAESLNGKRSLLNAVTQMLTATGSMKETPAAAFALAHKDPAALAETTSRVLLGVESRCFRCHDHPLGGRILDDYYAFKACFVGVRRTQTDAERHLIWSETRLRHPDTSLPVTPAVLGTPLDIAKGHDPRRALAKWIVSPKNPQFARSVVDRYWKQLFGSGLAFETDGFRSTAVSAQSELLGELGEEFATHDYDPRHLLRVLCNSDAYQLSSDLRIHREAAPAFFHRRMVQRIPSHLVLRMIERMNEVSAAECGLKPAEFENNGAYIFRVFRRRQATDCDLNGNDAYLGSALKLLNSGGMNKLITHPKGRAARLAASKLTDRDIVDELYMAGFCRSPTGAERKVAIDFMNKEAKKPGGRRRSIEDIIWAILNTKEFLFNT